MAPSDAELYQIFQMYDKDGSGKIDLDELAAALSQGGKEMSRAEVENIVKLVDKNNVSEASSRSKFFSLPFTQNLFAGVLV